MVPHCVYTIRNISSQQQSEAMKSIFAFVIDFGHIHWFRFLGFHFCFSAVCVLNYAPVPVSVQFQFLPPFPDQTHHMSTMCKHMYMYIYGYDMAWCSLPGPTSLIQQGFRQMFWPSCLNLCQMSLAAVFVSIFISFRLAWRVCFALYGKISWQQTHMRVLFVHWTCILYTLKLTYIFFPRRI